MLVNGSGGGIGLDASNVGRGDPVVGVATEQVSSGFDGAKYGEKVDPTVHEGCGQGWNGC